MKIPLLVRILRVYCWCILVLIGCSTKGLAQAGKPLPRPIAEYISSIEYGKLGNTLPVVRYSRELQGVIKVQLSWELKDTLRQDDWQVTITPAFQPVFHWSPHLTPTDNYIIAQHVFRAPALVCSAPGKQLIVIPDLDKLKAGSPVSWYMDLRCTGRRRPCCIATGSPGTGNTWSRGNERWMNC